MRSNLASCMGSLKGTMANGKSLLSPSSPAIIFRVFTRRWPRKDCCFDSESPILAIGTTEIQLYPRRAHLEQRLSMTLTLLWPLAIQRTQQVRPGELAQTSRNDHTEPGKIPQNFSPRISWGGDTAVLGFQGCFSAA